MTNLHEAPEVFALVSGEAGDQWVMLCDAEGAPVWGISARSATDAQAIAEAVRALKLPHRGPVGAEFLGAVLEARAAMPIPEFAFKPSE